MPVQAFIALGSNLASRLGDRNAHIEAGLAGLAALRSTRVTGRSTVLVTAPVGPPGQDDYLNAVASVQTELPPRELLSSLLEIERSRGRDRSREQRWGPRTLDLDLLLYGDLVIHEPGLVVPHPRLHERAFVLDPLAQLAPDLTVPGLGMTVRELASRVPRE